MSQFLIKPHNNRNFASSHLHVHKLFQNGVQKTKHARKRTSKIVVNICFNIYVKVGAGCLEEVYEEILCHELDKIGIAYKRKHYFPVPWESITLRKGFRVDILVEDCLVVELKSVLEIRKVDFVRLKTYLKLLDKRLGLISMSL